MARSSARTVSAYLKELPLEARAATHNGRPLCYAGLAAQKNHFALYLTCACQDTVLRKRLEDGFRKAGRKLDMGKSCLRFQTVDDLPTDIITGIIASATPMTGRASAIGAMAQMVAACVAATSGARRSRQDDIRQVDAALQAHSRLAVRMDHAGIAALFTDDGELVDPGQEIVKGRKAMRSTTFRPAI